MAKWAKWNAVEFIDYIDFEENFHWGWDFTPEHASELIEKTCATLNSKPKKKGWEKALINISTGDSSTLEVVAKKHEKLAYLVCLDQAYQQLKDDFKLEKDKPIGRQLAELADNEKFLKFAEQHAMDPMFRKALHAAGELTRSGDGMENVTSRKLISLEEKLNKAVMMRTLNAPTDEQLQSLKESMEKQGKGDQVLDTVLKNQEQQRIMAKMLFMGHLAGAKVNKKGKQSDLSGNMCDLLTHGGRVMVTLPAGNMQQEQFDAILGSHKGDSAGVYGRVFATHGVTNTKLNEDGSIKENAEEYKPGGAFHSDMHKNYGMDVSIGGLGAKGTRDITIQPDGTNGHAYMKMVPGGKNACGAMLFGVESSAPGKSSQLGQTHDAKAVKSKQSPFLSHKKAMGDAYGGRTIDFSQMDSGTFVSIMNRFDEYYSMLQNYPEDLEKFNNSLCGKQMEKDKISEFLRNDLHVNPLVTDTIVEQMRSDHVEKEKRVQIDAASKAPKQPNFFKRWFQSMNQNWQEQNKAYEDHVKEQQAERIRKQNALEDALEAVPASWSKDGMTKTSTVLSSLANIAKNATIEHDLTNSAALMVHALDRAAAKSSYTKLDDLGNIDIHPNELDPSKVRTTPMFRYLMNNRKQEMLEICSDPTKACDQMSTLLLDTARKFTPEKGREEKSRDTMKELFDELNVPGLEKRSQEYQDMVAAVERAARSDKSTPEINMRVFNAVQAYVGAKSSIPTTEMGKKSLSLAFQAMEAALPEQHRKEMMKDYKPRREALDRAMGREREEPRQTLSEQQLAVG